MQMSIQKSLYKPVQLIFDRIRIGGIGVAETLQKDATTFNTDHDYQHIVPIILQHGLLSGKDGWRTYLRELHRALQEVQTPVDIIAVDARHHGSSMLKHSVDVEKINYPGLEHSTGHLLADMVGDTLELLRNVSTVYSRRPILVGHSMGSKTNMLTALLSPSNVQALISLDASPAQYTHSHSNLLSAMNALPLERLHTTQQAVNTLFEQVPDKNTCAFACTNLVPAKHNQSLQWRLNLPVLIEQELHVHEWPLDRLRDLLPNVVFASEKTEKSSGPYPSHPSHHVYRFQNESLFLGGDQSSRLTTAEYLKDLPGLFPCHSLHMLRGGHFVHQGPDAKICAEISAKFIQQQTK